MAKSIVVTHGDVDGMVCAAQLIRHERSDCEVVFSSARYINGKLRGILRGEAKPEQIYVTDIPANAGTARYIDGLQTGGTEVMWIDHHPWPETAVGEIKRHCAMVIHEVSMSLPAGILTGRWLKEKDPYCWQIARICYACKEGTEWERNWFRLLSSYVAKSERSVLERLAYNQALTEQDTERIKQQEQKEAMALNVLAKEPESVKTASGKTVALYDTSQLNGMYLGHKVFEHHDIDFSLIRISDRKWQLASNPRYRHSMETLMGRHSIEGFVFTIDGRKDELLAIEAESTNCDPHQHILKFISGKL